MESAADVRRSIRCRFSRRAAQQPHPLRWHLSSSTQERGDSSSCSIEKGRPCPPRTPGCRLLFPSCLSRSGRCSAWRGQARIGSPSRRGRPRREANAARRHGSAIGLSSPRSGRRSPPVPSTGRGTERSGPGRPIAAVLRATSEAFVAALFLAGFASGLDAAECRNPGDQAFVPAGPFWMGSDERERGLARSLSSPETVAANWFSAELPRRQAELEAFCIDRRLVTQGR